MKPSELAVAVAKRMENADMWTTFYNAINACGDSVPSGSIHARKWCAMGHAQVVASTLNPALGGVVLRLRLEYFDLFGRPIELDNDGKGREVTRQRLLDLATHLEKRGQ